MYFIRECSSSKYNYSCYKESHKGTESSSSWEVEVGHRNRSAGKINKELNSKNKSSELKNNP